MKNILPMSSVVGLMFIATPTLATGAEKAIIVQQPNSTQEEQIYGWEFMSPQEQRDYQAKIRSLSKSTEREAFSREHSKKMKLRRRAAGVGPDPR